MHSVGSAKRPLEGPFSQLSRSGVERSRVAEGGKVPQHVVTVRTRCVTRHGVRLWVRPGHQRVCLKFTCLQGVCDLEAAIRTRTEALPPPADTPAAMPPSTAVLPLQPPS